MSPRILTRVQQERLGKLEIRTRFKTIQTTAMLKSPRILRRVQQERLGKLEIRTRFKTIQTTAMLKSPRILRRVQQEMTRETGDQNKIQDHPDHSNVKIT